MALVQPPAMRSTIEDGPEGLSVLIPSRKQIIGLIFLPFWLVGWAFGEFTALRSVIAGQDRTSFLLVWVTGWTIGGALAILTWFWGVAGRERVVAGAGTLAHRYELLGFSRSQEYDVSQLKNLRVSPEVINPWAGGGMRQWGIGGGSVAFDYGSKTVRFGAVDEAEAATIVDLLSKRLRLAPSQVGQSTLREPPLQPSDDDPFWNQD